MVVGCWGKEWQDYKTVFMKTVHENLRQKGGGKELASPSEWKSHREYKLWRDLRQDSPIHTVTGCHVVMTICGSLPDPFNLWSDEREECLKS